MNGYERLMAVLEGKTVDRPPKMLHNFMVAAEEKGYSMADYRSDPKKIARAHIDAARKYSLDGILIDIDTCLEAGAIGAKLDLPENEPARVVGPASEDLDILIEMMDKTRLESSPRIQVLLDSISLIRKEVGGELLIRGNADQGPFSLAMLCYGMTSFLMDLLDDQRIPKIQILLNRAADVHIHLHKLVKNAGADITSFGDSLCGPDLISREMYLEHSYPYQKRIYETLKKDNIKTICHICGNLDNILEDLVKIGFEGIEIDYKTDVSRSQTLCQGKSTVFGIVDPSGIFYYGTPEQVYRETQNTLKIFSGKGIVVGAGCALPTGTPEENMMAYSRAVEEFSKTNL